MNSFQTNIDKMRGLAPVNDLFTPTPAESVNVNSPKGADAVPAMSGRSSIPQNMSLFGVITGEMGQIMPGFELETLKVCAYLAKYNGDVSYAVDNVVQLGNTPHHITFDKTVKEDQAKKMIKTINTQGRWLYSGAIRSLINDMFAQLYVSGAISVEMIPDKTISYVQKVALVSPYTVRFMYNPDTYDYDAFQTSNNSMGLFVPPQAAGTNFGQMGLHKLNPVTYRYIAHRRFDDNPFAIPPIISSFEGIEIEKDMLNNMRHIVRKMGVFGFLSVMLTAPLRKQGETEVAYFARCTTYLNQVRPEVEKGYATGVALGFKGFQEWKVEAGNTNLAGAKEIFQLVSEIKMAGLKQDPLMLGRNFNVAETMAKVIMAKLTTQISSYQAVVAVFLEDLYKTMLLLNGYKLDRVMVKFEPPMIGDKLREEQAKEKKLVNLIMQRDTGIIGQEDVARAMEQEEAYAPKNVDYTVPSAADLAIKIKSKDPSIVDDSINPGATNYSLEYLEQRINKGAPEFSYDNCECGHSHTQSFSSDSNTPRKLLSAIAAYRSAATDAYHDAISKVTLVVEAELKAMSENATLQQVTDRIFYSLYTAFSGKYATAQGNVASTHTNWYNEFRSATHIFGDATEVTDKGGNTKPIPKASFSPSDAKALDYFKSIDALFLVRFITDKDTKAAISKFISDSFYAGTIPLADKHDMVDTFLNGFSSMLKGEGWKIDRVVETSVVKMYNYAAISYLKEAGIASFRVEGVTDSKQCKYCAAMQGYTFSVLNAYDSSQKAIQGNPYTLAQDAPFINSMFKGQEGIDRIKSLTGEELQAQGFMGIPPMHPLCRCLIYAVI